MILVALTSLSAPVETEVEALARDLGIPAYEVRARVLTTMPAVIFASRDAAAASELCLRVTARGHRVVNYERAEVEPSHGMYAIRRCWFEAEALVVPDGAALPYDDVITLVLTSAAHAHTLYLFRRSGRQSWIAREGEVDPIDSETGTRVAEYKRFSRFQRELRRRATGATFDDRLLDRVMSPSVGTRSGSTSATVSDILAHTIRLDVSACRSEDEEIALVPGTIFANRYRVMSAVPPRPNARGPRFLAERTTDGAPVSLKLYPRRELGHARVRDGFATSMRAWQSAKCVHAVDILDHGKDAATSALYVATELLRGLTLEELVARLGGLQWLESREVVRRVGEGLIELRAAGVTYGQLRPSDVFVTPGAVKLLDAGTTPLVDASVGRDPHAPELCPASQIAHLAFFTLTGMHYFKLANEEDADRRALAREVSFGARRSASMRAREYGKDDVLPHGFDEWFHACAAPTTECADFRAALAGFLTLTQ